MNVIRNNRVQATVGLTLLALIAVLLFMSNRTNQAEHDSARRALEAVELGNMRLDMGLFPLLFEFRMDFDEITATEQELKAAAEAFHALVRSPLSARLAELFSQKLEATSDFKAEQAVIRNSRAIATEMIAELWESPALEDRRSRDGLFDVERAFLDFIARRDPPSAQHLRQVMSRTAGQNRQLAATSEWAILEAHMMKLLDTTDFMAQILQSVYTLPIPQTILRQADLLSGELSRMLIVSGRYHTAMSIVAVLLLAFSAFKVIEVGRYVQLLRTAKDELEERVRQRTKELADAHEALVKEMAERENVVSQLRIAQKLESIGQLAAGIAHEINTPTQYVSDNVTFLEGVWHDIAPLLEGYEQAMDAGRLDVVRSRELWRRADVDYLRAEVPAALEQARDGLRQIADIVMAIKNFSHPGSSDRQAADLNAAIRNTAVVARNEWKYVAELTFDLDPSLPPVICDLSAFNQVLLNLIVNAAQAIGERREPEGVGRITITTRYRDGCVEICVEDDGPGVPAELRERIFDPFFTTKPVGKGTGQGLAIAHRVVGQHGGTLTVETGRRHGGALFSIRLPLEAAMQIEEAAPLARLA